MKPAPSPFLSDIKPNMAALPPPPTGTVILVQMFRITLLLAIISNVNVCEQSGEQNICNQPMVSHTHSCPVVLQVTLVMTCG